MFDQTVIPPAFGVLGLVFAFIIFALVKRYSEGEDKVKKIADQIHVGAMVFMRREYTMLLVFALVLLIILWISGLGTATVVAFILGLMVCFFFVLVGIDLIAVQLDGASPGLGSALKNYVGVTANFQDLTRGVIEFRTVTYFLLMTLGFLVLDVLTVSTVHESGSAEDRVACWLESRGVRVSPESERVDDTIRPRRLGRYGPRRPSPGPHGDVQPHRRPRARARR